MQQFDKYQKKMVLALSRLADHENQELRKIRILAPLCSFGGVLLIVAAVLESLLPHWPLPMITIIGIVGGLLLGLGAYFHSSLKQWPVLKLFLNVDAIREKARELKP